MSPVLDTLAAAAESSLDMAARVAWADLERNSPSREEEEDGSIKKDWVDASYVMTVVLLERHAERMECTSSRAARYSAREEGRL